MAKAMPEMQMEMQIEERGEGLAQPANFHTDPDADASDVALSLKAVGLRYAQGSGGLPTISASGRGHVAAKLIELAREYGIEVREDADLAEILSVMQEGDEIPVEAIHAVAQLLAWIYRQRDEAPSQKTNRGSLSETNSTRQINPIL